MNPEDRNVLDYVAAELENLRYATMPDLEIGWRTYAVAGPPYETRAQREHRLWYDTLIAEVRRITGDGPRAEATMPIHDAFAAA
jgi:hypothetical protein